MRSLPAISALPVLMSADGWRWERNGRFPKDFWLGEDSNGSRWLVKLHGSFYSFREHAFARLAQHLGLSCQSSVLLKLPQHSPPRREQEDLEECQIALELLDEHADALCSPSCPLSPLELAVNSATGDRVALVEQAGVANASDWIRADMLAYLCGANEPCDQLITKDHQLVIIDSEQMFSTDSVELRDCDWFESTNGDKSTRALQIADALCSRLAKTTDFELGLFSAVPDGYVVNQLWSIGERMLSARRAARRYTEDGIFAA